MSEVKTVFAATVDIMSPGSAFVIVDGCSAHVWGKTGNYTITIEGDDAHHHVRNYKAAVKIVASDFGKIGTVRVVSENEGSGKVTRYEVEIKK